jgi:hypothetical protein
LSHCGSAVEAQPQQLGDFFIVSTKNCLQNNGIDALEQNKKSTVSE